MKSLLYKEKIKKNILLVAIWGAVIVTGFLALWAIIGVGGITQIENRS